MTNAENLRNDLISAIAAAEGTDTLEAVRVQALGKKGSITQLMKTLGETHGIILCTHILPELQAVCNRVQIINCGELVYSSSIDELLDRQSTKFEITLSSITDRDELVSHAAFNSVEMIGENSFIAESDLSASKLTEYIVNQQWGLTRFTPHEVSLEQIFIDLTAGETNMGNEQEPASL